MTKNTPSSLPPKRSWLNMTIVALVGQVGCLTLLIVLGAVFAGLWLDSRFDTRPWFTIGLVLASIPVSLIVMLFVTRLAVKKIKTTPAPKQGTEEDGFGKNT
jgi:MFS-type transporter involved in bile tolerance (Atg22 family)